MLVGDLKLKNLGGYLDKLIFPSEVIKPLWFVNLLLTPLDKYIYELSKEFDLLSHFNYPSYIPLNLDGKFWYARCSDKFIIGVSGSYKDAVFVRKILIDFLEKELNLTLITDIIKITHLRSNYAEFLGYSVTVSSYPELSIPKKVIKEWLIKSGLANQAGKPKYVGRWIYLSDAEIVDRFNNFIRDLIEYYKLGENRRDLHESLYIIKYSFFHTIAAKHRLKLKQVLKKYTFDKINLKLVVCDS